MLTTQLPEQVARRGLGRAAILCSASLAFILGAVSLRGAIASHSQLLSNQPTVTSTVAPESKPSFKSANVLVIHSYNPELSWTEQQKDGIDQGFANSPHTVTVYHEFLDAKRYPQLAHRQTFLDHLRNKYQNTPLDVLMIADDPGLQMLLEIKQDYFPKLPVVFMGINNVQEELLNIPWLTGVFENHSIEDTLWIAQEQTDSGQVIVITDSSETGRANRSRLEALNKTTDQGKSFIFVEDVPDSKIQDILGGYPDHMPIFLGGQLRKDRPNGALIDFDQETAVLRSNLPNPIYTDAKMRMGHGAVGGKVLDGSFHAEQAVQLAEQILSGTPLSNITPIIQSKNQWIFDAEELKRLNFDIKDLPPNSELINHKLSFYEQNRTVVWATLGLFSLGGLIILALANAIRLQKRAEMNLKENERHLEQRVNERTEELRATLDTLKTTQARLLQTEKSSSLGRLMGGLAHEFNNPLGFIAGNIECLEDYTQNLIRLVNLYQTQTGPAIARQYSNDIDLPYIQEDIPKILKSMSHGTGRIQSLVQTLNEFVRVNEEGFKPTNLNSSLDTTLLILHSQLSSDIKVIKDYAALPLIHCNPRDLNQVLMSILLNAIEALSTSETDPKNIQLKTSLLSEDWVRISISDTGPGISPEHQSKIFEPFFTTKTVGQGMGMGLALCNQTIQQHKGRLHCTSTLGVGTTFNIELPINMETSSG